MCLTLYSGGVWRYLIKATAQARLTLPTLIQEKKRLFGIGYRKTPSPKKREKINEEDQEGCRLNLKPADESW